MNILAMDTADQIFSVALETGENRWYLEIDAGSRHSELLMEGVNWLHDKAQIKPSELNLIACMKGPGSFTGLRIGFSAAKGIAVALGIPLITVSTLDCLAYPHSLFPGIAVPAIDAKKDCFFTAFYREGKRLCDYMDSSTETIVKELEKTCLSPSEPIILTGCGAELLYSRITALSPAILEHENSIRIDPVSRSGRARELLDIVKKTKLSGHNEIDNGPVYLRKSDAELNCKKE